MDLKTEILKEHSKSNTFRLLEWIGNDENKLEQLFALFLMEDQKLVQRSSWIITSLAEASPDLIQKYLPLMINRMVNENVHVGVRRNIIRSLQFVQIPQTLEGTVLNACFSFLENPKEGNVVQVFSMTVIEKLTEEYPELIPEFICIIERNLENEPSPAFRNRAFKTLIRLRKH